MLNLIEISCKKNERMLIFLDFNLRDESAYLGLLVYILTLSCFFLSLNRTKSKFRTELILKLELI